MSRQARSQQIRVRRARAPQQRRIRKTTVPAEHRDENRRAQMYMFSYKVGDGRRRVTLNNGVYNYGIEKCRHAFKEGDECPDGDECEFAHNMLEIVFHPLTYRTRPCLKKSSCIRRDSCARAHSNEEMRIVRNILGRDWKLADPVSKRKAEREAAKKNKKKKRRQKALAGAASEEASTDSVSGMSETSSKLTNMSVSASTSPPSVEEEEKKTNMTADGVWDFEGWFRGRFDCDDDGKPFVGYLRRFEASGLNDVALLWELSVHDPGKFMDLLVDEIRMDDEGTRRRFRRELDEYKMPRDVRSWMRRVVGLPQYAAALSKMASGVGALSRMALDDGVLAEIGVSSAGHRARILLEVARVKIVGGADEDPDDSMRVE